MGTYLKFTDFSANNFNNAEFLSFLRRFRALLPFPEQGGDRPEIESLSVNESNGVPALGVSAAQLTVLDAVIDQLTDLNNQSRISQETETLNDTDKQRDNVATPGRTGSRKVSAERSETIYRNRTPPAQSGNRNDQRTPGRSEKT